MRTLFRPVFDMHWPTTLCVALLLVAAAPAYPASAQRPAPVTSRSGQPVGDSASFFLAHAMLTDGGFVNLTDRAWRYQSGDDPSWAAPDFNDTGWLLARPPLDPNTPAAEAWNGIGWFRLHLVVDSSLANTTIALSLDHFGVSEIYLDGVLVHRFGQFRAIGEREQTGYPMLVPIGLHLDGRSEHMLAVRYSFYSGRRLFRKYGRLLESDIGFRAWASELDERIGSYVSNLNVLVGVLGLFFGVLILMSFLHFMMFRFFERDRSNLYLSTFSFCVSGVILVQIFPVYVRPPIELAVVAALSFYVLATGAMVSLLALLYSIFDPDKLRRIGPIVICGSIAVAATILLQLKWIALIFWAGVFVEAIRVVAMAVSRREDGAWIVFAGVLGFIIPVIIDSLSTTPPPGSIGPTVGGFVTSGFIYLSMPTAMSVSLARRFALTNRDLEGQLVQVRMLSRKTLEQEMERKRLVEQQNELLEAQVAKRTFELQESLSHLKQTQDQLIQQEKLASLGALASGIAHEIKNPLNFVNNFAGFSSELTRELRDTMASRPDAPTSETLAEVSEIISDLESNAQKIVEHGQRADGIVQSMLLHSRSTPGVREPTDLNELLEQYVRLFEHGLGTDAAVGEVAIERRYDSDVGTVVVLWQEMGRVFANLLTNAFQAVRERSKAASSQEEYEPTVFVETARHGDRVLIRIRDNGNGVPATIHDRIFEPFFTTKPTGSGTGLGLSISHGIVTQGHGGQLTIRSEEGVFAEFTIELPAPAVSMARKTLNVEAPV